MDLTAAIEEVAGTVRGADAVVAVGGGTQRGVGGAVPSSARVVRAPGGIVRFDPADLTVTVGAGTSCAELAAVLRDAGQECPLDPRDQRATVGGVLATGLSGVRRLRLGPVRDHVLETRLVTAEGRVVKGGGPTVKNVTGYDVPRLMVGSLGTLGVLVQVTLRSRPLPRATRWGVTDEDPATLRARLLRPSALLWDGARTHVLAEGHEADVDAMLRAGHLEPTAGPPAWPAGRHRARISVPPAALRELADRLRDLGLVWLAECGVGTVHVASTDVGTLLAAREHAEALDGRLLREAGAAALDPFGTPPSTAALQQRVKRAVDPDGRLAPGRIPWLAA